MASDVLHDLRRTPAQALEDSSVDLAVDDSFVDQMSAVVAGPDALGGDLRRAGVDLDLDGAHAPAVAKVRVALEGALVPGEAFRMLVVGFDCEVLFLVVPWLHQVGSPFDELSDYHGRSACGRRAGVGNPGCVGIPEDDFLDGDLKHVGRDLGKDGVETLAHLRLAAEDLNRSVLELVELRPGLDDRLLSVSGEGSAVVVEGDSYSSSLSPLVLFALPLVIAGLHDLLQHLGDHDALDDLAVGACRVALLDEVALLVLKRVNALHLGYVAQVRLDCEQGLRCAEAPERAAWERVGRHSQSDAPDVGEAVAPRDVEAAPLKDDEAGGKVASYVVADGAVHGYDVAVLVKAGLEDDLGRMALDGVLYVLLPVEEHAHALLHYMGRKKKRSAEDIGEVLLASEGSACGGLSYDDLVGCDVQNRRDGLGDVERALGACVDDVVAILRHAAGSVGLEVDVLLETGFDRLRDDLVGLLESLVHVSDIQGQAAVDVVVVDERPSLALQALVYGDGGSELLVIDPDLLLEVLNGGPVGSDEDPDALAHVADLVLRKAFPVGGYHVKIVVPSFRDVLVGDEPVAFGDLGEMDGLDDSAGDGGTDQSSPEAVIERVVGDVPDASVALCDRIHSPYRL